MQADAVLRHGASITRRGGCEKCAQGRNNYGRMANASLTSAPWHGSAPQRYFADMHVHMHRSQCSITATCSNTRHAPWSFFRHATARPCRSKRVVTYPQALARTIHIRCGQPATRWSFFRHILCEPCGSRANRIYPQVTGTTLHTRCGKVLAALCTYARRGAAPPGLLVGSRPPRYPLLPSYRRRIARCPIQS